MIGKSKRYVVKWRHRTLDAPEHPYHGTGYAYGSTRRKALLSFFGPPFAQSNDPVCRQHDHDRWSAYFAGNIEIVDMRACDRA